MADAPDLQAGTDLLYRVVATETDDFSLSMPAIVGDAFRASSTPGRVDITVRAYERMHLTTMDFGYRMLGRAAPRDGVVVLGLVLDASGSRWDGRELTNGDVVLLPPAFQHSAFDEEGLRIGIITIEREWLAESIEDLGRSPLALEQGPLRPDLAARVMRTFRQVPSHDDPSAVAASVASVLSTRPTTLPQPQRRISSATITARAIDYTHATGDWSPSSLTLCRAVGVSERRLQTAFAEMYGSTPSGFLRQQALAIARSRLLADGDGLPSPVTHVATSLGFGHLGRFAVQYRELFGETPSATLANGTVSRR